MITVFTVGWDEQVASERLQHVLQHGLAGRVWQVACTPREWERARLAGKDECERVLLFALAVPVQGLSHAYVDLVTWLSAAATDLTGWTGAVVVDGLQENFTKKIGRELILLANQAGCAFPGRPLVEATGSLYNFRTQSMVRHCSLLDAYAQSVRDVLDRAVLTARKGLPKVVRPHIVVVHASSRSTSNTLLLWEMIRRNMDNKAVVREISLRNGTVVDCRGCSYAACRHFGEMGDCFYGGVMVEKVYPAVMEADIVVLLCPNYNDAVSANITAFFNRLTALFRKEAAAFFEKRLYALVVSGYSGGDIVAEQVLGAMNCNKNFYLPGRFALLETANDPGSILQSPGITNRAECMARRILGEIP